MPKGGLGGVDSVVALALIGGINKAGVVLGRVIG